MGFQDVVFQPSSASYSPHFLKIVAEAKASGLRHVLKQWLWVSKGMLPVKHFHSNIASVVLAEFHGDHKTATKLS